MEEGTRIQVLAPLVRGRKGEFRDVFDRARREGFVRALVNGKVYDLREIPRLSRYENHDIGIIVDRLVIREEDRARLSDSVETALRAADGVVQVLERREAATSPTSSASTTPARTAATSFPELEPRVFSFNSPHGACAECGGLGTTKEVEGALLVGDPSLSILEGALIIPWGEPGGTPAGLGDSGSGRGVRIRSARALAGTCPGGPRRGSCTARAGMKIRFPYNAGKMKGTTRTTGKGSWPTSSAATGKPAPSTCGHSWTSTCPARRARPARVRGWGRSGGRCASGVCRSAAWWTGPSARSWPSFGSLPVTGEHSSRRRGARSRGAARRQGRGPILQGGAGAAGVPAQRGAGLPDAEPFRGHPFGGASPSASAWPPRSAAAWWACCTSSTSPPSGCTSATTTACSARSRTCATWGIRCWWWSTTRTRSARRTSSLDLGPGAGRAGGEVVAAGSLEDVDGASPTR